jgi:excisionase family DNA binding protein
MARGIDPVLGPGRAGAAASGGASSSFSTLSPRRGEGRGRGGDGGEIARLALSLDEAAAALGVSRDYFDEHVRPELRVVRRGRRVLVSTLEIAKWLDAASARALER